MSDGQIARWREAAARESWWSGDRRPDEPGVFCGPTMVAFTREATNAEWLAQAFREAVSRVHDAESKLPPDPIMEWVRRSAEAGDSEARAVLGQAQPHLNVEDADYNCEHPFCVRWWPMVRAAEARARLEGLDLT